MWKRVSCWLLVLIWLVVIFWFSGKTGPGSNKQSKEFTEYVASSAAHAMADLGMIDEMPTEERIDELTERLNPIMRKCAHATVYFILAILVLIALFTKQENFGIHMLITIAICFAYSLTDEWHQTFIPGRAGMFVDCLIDTLGAVLGCLVYLVPVKVFSRKNKKEE